MNRIVLIGNGFDLAHGLKTSYADFINWYLDEWGKLLLKSFNKKEEDRFYSFKIKENVGASGWFYLWNFYCTKNTFPPTPWTKQEILQIVLTENDFCDYNNSSPMFESICHQIDKGWVDIEEVYYNFLKSSDNPKQLNEDLDFLKNKLIEYLKSIPEATINPNIQEQILESFNREDIAISSMDKWDKLEPDYIMILNFNYTNTADMYLPKAYNYSINHIHGNLSNPESVIFGYGDERDDEYDVLMKKNDNEYLQHIKSFRYLEASNYRNMLSFIESAPYQVCIMGHSCGLSDRTLLATLFEHKNCVSIKPYYHKKDDGTDNYRELIQNIARNFKDPTLMRDRVVRKDRCEPLG